ncbi:aminotransferase class IV [Myxococcota bacterium]|nr:aminotransferase class IV [Myxococcota bacterium]
MTTLVCSNGVLLPPEQATVSVFDRGFLYGDSVYEVVRTYDGVPFELGLHLERLAGSASRLGMVLPVGLDVLTEETWRTHRATKNRDSYLRIVVTRGAGEIGLDPALAERPLRLVIAQTLKTPPAELYERGAKVALVSVRRNLREAIDPQAKTGNYLNSVLAVAEARRSGAYEAVMLDHRDFVTEGASSNVFAVVGGVVLTPPLDAGILKGVTRHVVFEVARRAGLRTLEVPLTEPILRSADEVFITSSIRELVPIVAVDDTIIGDGRPGPIAKRLREGFAAYVREHNEGLS